MATQRLRLKDIPPDYAVRPLKNLQAAKARATCGTCGLSWDDGVSTSMTPTPSARCPFEAFHKPEKPERPTMATKVRFRPLRKRDVTFTLSAEEETISIRGNLIATDDPELDKREEDAAIARLNDGDVWAWCTVGVTAEWQGHKATEYLGGCSYRDAEDFKTGGYYPQMCEEALARLNAELSAMTEKLGPRLEMGARRG